MKLSKSSPIRDQADAANDLADYNPMDDDDLYDYNPFGTEQGGTTQAGTGTSNTTEASDPVAAQMPCARVDNTLQDLRTRFPNYGWEADDEHKEEGMTVLWNRRPTQIRESSNQDNKLIKGIQTFTSHMIGGSL